MKSGRPIILSCIIGLLVLALSTASGSRVHDSFSGKEHGRQVGGESFLRTDNRRKKMSDNYGSEKYECLNNMVIILVDPSHYGNIGSASRAMKTMGLSKLRIVSSNGSIITDEALALSKGAADVLKSAEVFSTLDEALADVTFVAGTSARHRSIELPLYQPREAVEKIRPHLMNGMKCAIMFGRERTGLTNEELQRCDIHINIDANPEYSSLNLAMSVQVLSYELRQACLRSATQEPLADFDEGLRKPKHSDLEQFYNFIEKNLCDCGFLKKNHNGSVMGQIRRVYAKADMSAHELRIIYGTLASMLKHRPGNGE